MQDGAPSDVLVAVWVVVPLHHSPPETGGRCSKSLYFVQAILSPICCREVHGESELAAAAVLRIPLSHAESQVNPFEAGWLKDSSLESLRKVLMLLMTSCRSKVALTSNAGSPLWRYVSRE
uniref:Uncharacterized protein n=1 Tax=Heliothis virescens TaxID=7102 RepID=A0A2A4JFI2_HELVI